MICSRFLLGRRVLERALGEVPDGVKVPSVRRERTSKFSLREFKGLDDRLFVKEETVRASPVRRKERAKPLSKLKEEVRQAPPKEVASKNTTGQFLLNDDLDSDIMGVELSDTWDQRFRASFILDSIR